MAVAFTITEINYLVVSLFCDVALPLSYLYWPVTYIFICGIKLPWLRCFLVSGIATKRLWLPQNHLLYFSRRTSGRVTFKQMFSINSVLQIVMVVVLC